MQKILGLVLQVRCSFLLNPTLNTSPKPHAIKSFGSNPVYVICGCHENTLFMLVFDYTLQLLFNGISLQKTILNYFFITQVIN